MTKEIDKSKRFHILSDAEFGWHEILVDSADTLEEANSLVKDMYSWCDPYEVLTVRDTGE